METNVPTTEFSHRDIPEGESLPIDIYSTIANSVSDIQNFTELLNSKAPMLLGDETNDFLLKQIELSSLDILAVMENLVNNYEITKIDNELELEE